MKNRYQKLRAALRSKYGARKYQITRDDEVYIYGVKPNSQTVGWWYMGDIIVAELWLGLVPQWLNENTTIIGETDTGFVYCSSF